VADTKKRYLSKDYHAQLKNPDLPDPEFEEVEVVDIDTPNGPRRVYVDQVEQYAAVVAEMEGEES
jgi:hypothetical protein